MSLTSQPAVRHHTDEVLGWERFKHRDKELDCVLVLTKILLEEEKLMVENYLTVHVLYQGESKLHPEGGPGDWLDMAYQTPNPAWGTGGHIYGLFSPAWAF